MPGAYKKTQIRPTTQIYTSKSLEMPKIHKNLNI